MSIRVVKQKKTTVIRCRCDDNMKFELARIALMQGLDQSDLMRQAITNLIRQFNRSLPEPGSVPVNA